jgi:hypothetical protein
MLGVEVQGEVWLSQQTYPVGIMAPSGAGSGVAEWMWRRCPAPWAVRGRLAQGFFFFSLLSCSHRINTRRRRQLQPPAHLGCFTELTSKANEDQSVV